jgi:hypothetical protein
VRPRRPRGRHDLPGERARAGDHDKLPAGGADCEGIGIMLLENAQDVGDLRAAIRAGLTPADNDPLTDIGRNNQDSSPSNLAASTCTSATVHRPACTTSSPCADRSASVQ